MRLILLLAVCFLCSCAHSTVERIGAIDISQKTMAVRQGGGELTLSLKRALRQNGWQVITSTGITVNPGAGASFSDAQGPKARYSMEVEASFVDYDIGFRPIYRATISVVDTVTHEEVMTLTGLDLGINIVKKTMEALK